MNKIDIVVPYVDETDPEWKKDFEYYRQQEVELGIQTDTNKQAFGKARVRDWNTLKYWFRGVEKNCPWVNKVFFVVQRESQIPDWLDRNNPKLRIILHEEFIPKELLPTFSTLTIETFYYKIEDLSENFIVCNDDFFFLNPIPSDLFFDKKGIKQGLSGYRSKNWTCGNPVWETIVNNTSAFLEQYIIRKPTVNFFHYSHLPDGRVKSFETQLMSKQYDRIYAAMSISRFRHSKNIIPSLVFIDAMKYKNYGRLDKRVYSNSKYVAINSNTNFNDYRDCEMICFNDTEWVGDFGSCKNQMLAFFESKFPDKSSFELYDVKTPLKICFGVPSWIPDNDYARGHRIDRLNRMFKQLYDLFGNKVDWLIIAQNWKEYKQPDFIENIDIVTKPQLGILGARNALREEFLKRDYDYIIMLDDDLILDTTKEACDKYLEEIQNHRDGYCFLQYAAAQLNLCAISRVIYEKEPMVDIDPQKSEGYEDKIYSELIHYKYPNKEFHVDGIKATQFQNRQEKAPSTWADNNKYNFKFMNDITWLYINEFKNHNFNVAAIKRDISNGKIKSAGMKFFTTGDVKLDERIKTALDNHWISTNDIPRLIEQWRLK